MATPAGAGTSRFAGAARAATYTEASTPAIAESPIPVSGDIVTFVDLPEDDLPENEKATPAPASTETRQRSLVPVGRTQTRRTPAAATTATRGLRDRLKGLGLKLVAGRPERTHMARTDAIRQATWTRPRGILVANEKGGSGKTPTAVIIAGILATIRSEPVAIAEFTEFTGTLSRRSEGVAHELHDMLANDDVMRTRLNGSQATFAELHDMLANDDAMRTSLSGSQATFAHVVGADRGGPRLHGDDVVTARRILDRYYRLTVVDTGTNHLADCYQAAARTCDAVVIPVPVTPDGLDGALRTIDGIRRYTDLHRRVTAVITHTGGFEPETLRRTLPATLAHVAAHVVEVPADPEIGHGGPITITRLSPPSHRAWTEVAVHVVGDLTLVPETPLL